MPRTLHLPSGATVSLREKREITERQRRPFMLMQAANAVSEDGVDRMQRGRDVIDGMEAATIVCVIGWSLSADDGTTRPVVADSLQDLQIDDYDMLMKECLNTLAEAAPSFEPSPDPESPTQAAQP